MATTCDYVQEFHQFALVHCLRLTCRPGTGAPRVIHQPKTGGHVNRPCYRDEVVEPRWLNEQEQYSWVSFLVMHTKLAAEMHRQLHTEFGLSLADFDVLSQLANAPEGGVRASKLGRFLQWEKSRLSHQLKRMEQRGLIRREDCLEDSRGAMVVATELGREVIEHAAPSHVKTVRELVFDQLTKREIESLGRISNKVLARLQQMETSSRRSS